MEEFRRLISTFGPAAGAAALMLLGIYMLAAACIPSLGALSRWGRNGNAGPVSPLGHVAWGLCAFGWAAICGFNALAWWQSAAPFVFAYMLLATGLLFFAGFRDMRAFRRGSSPPQK